MSSNLTDEALAHLTKDGKPHRLTDHLECVSNIASEFASAFGSGEWAKMAGIWHDLGKFSGQFQRMIRELNGFECHIQDSSGPRDHSTAGAVHAVESFGSMGFPIAYVIAGHHGGLSDREELSERLKLKTDLLDKAKSSGQSSNVLQQSMVSLPTYLAGSTLQHKRIKEMWIRMLYSTICDADFLDTESFYNPEKSLLHVSGPSNAELETKLVTYINNVTAGATKTEVNCVRADIKNACIDAASNMPGVYSLTAPTGGAKTLSSMAFALTHARVNNLRRVVVAIPFTSIIEQSADQYRKSLGDDAVIEHHSSFEPNKETSRNRIACENWDAPVIVTTTVQLFESLFANRSGACRKLHRLVNSVIVLDEVQTLPPGMLIPILDSLKILVNNFGCTVVFCTATQPAFVKAPWLDVGFENIHEIVSKDIRAFERLRRVKVVWPKGEVPTEYSEIAVEMAKEHDVLAIVHKREDARVLCSSLDECLGDMSTVHLSALMCPDHRRQKLADIKVRKGRGEHVRLVSTQLIEAGVDVDFAIVYRALAGLDSMAQAAGRCNREGKLMGLGELRVFLATTSPPPGVLQSALEVTKVLLRKNPDLDLFDPQTQRQFFKLLYLSKNLDTKKIQVDRQEYNFKTVAKNFRLIENDWSLPVVVPWGDSQKCIEELERCGPSRDRLRTIQRFTVSVNASDRENWVVSKRVRVVADTVYVIDTKYLSAYDNRYGLVPERLG